MQTPIESKGTSDTSFTDDVARLYEATLVPLIFEAYAEDLAGLPVAQAAGLHHRRARHGSKGPRAQ